MKCVRMTQPTCFDTICLQNNVKNSEHFHLLSRNLSSCQLPRFNTNDFIPHKSYPFRILNTTYSKYEYANTLFNALHRPEPESADKDCSRKSL